MRIASWNVNSLKVRLEQVLDWLEAHQPDVLGLQETKLTDANFPAETFRELGYHVSFSGQPTYNGVALISRAPQHDVVTDLDGLDDHQRRVLGATIDGIRVLDLYVPNGQAVGTEKYAYKLHWLEQLHNHLAVELARHPRCVVMGDFNIAPDDRDVHDPEEWAGKVLCSEPERAALQRILDLGFADTFRLFDQPESVFSWWDYRAAGFRRNRGLRIDLVLASKDLAGACKHSTVDVEPRRNERPSDHAPVVAVFEPA
ncbi:exodeoxyribonuclease III [Thioalkalivibrio sp. XN8]|uniref:exodeoxyribonuclease III n=1 Tax=Thioalkalivibrio sp. XN8 TaxID=2712863 RepID=UPI0013EC8167|nr:exodeoxyribonuclease III [Thioalkalivibrio sp. XN8]NGP53490.1 exodeoxyribonuclease III [Thioalkalivibrio sp. XN8]